MTTLKTFLTDLLIVTISIAAALLLLLLGLTLAKYPAAHVLADWFHGAIGTRTDLMVSLKNATPLILTGLAAGIAFRSGVFNIGAEGQSILGAIAATTIATRLLPAITTSWLAIPAALLTAALAGAAWALIAALLERLRRVSIILSTILLNFIALQFLGILLEGPLKQRSASALVQSDILPHAYFLPMLFTSSVASLHAGFLIAIATAVFCWLIQSRTTFGFEILVTGLNPIAAQYSGMNVAARQFAIMLFSGSFAGLAGAIQVMGIEGHSLGPTPTSYGYAGIAVALLGRLHPIGIVAAALFFGFLDQGASNVEFDFQLPHEVADIVKGLVVLIVLVGTAIIARRRTTAKEALMESLPAFILKQSATSAAPLLLAGFGELLAQRAGVINVGIEGTMLMGAIAAYAGAVYAGTAAGAIPAALLTGICFGANFALIVVWFRADQIVTGTAIDILALGASTTLWRLLQNYIAAGHRVPALFDPVPIPYLSQIPWLGPALFAQYFLFYVVAIAGAILLLIMRYTRVGLVIRALGDAPDACAAAGIRVRLWRTGLLLFAGAASGLAGAYLSTMRNHSYQINMTNGRGFLVLALVIFGRWNIFGFALGTLAFGAIDAFQTYLAASPGATAHIPHQLFDMLPYAATLLALAIMSRSRTGPLFLARPWPE